MSAIKNKIAIRPAVVIEVLKLSGVLVAISSARAPPWTFSRPPQVSAWECSSGQSRALKRKYFSSYFHLAPRISGALAICLSGRIPEFLAWLLSDFVLQNGCNLG